MSALIERAVVVGAGTMGHGIAHVLALCGIQTTLVDVKQELVDGGLAKINASLDVGVQKGKVTATDRDAAIARLSGSTDRPTALSTADLLVEAIPENLDWKRALFAEADAVMRPGALLASNTSSLSISKIAEATRRPHDVVGLHFFNPVHVMKLLEIVRGKLTSADTIARAVMLSSQLGKTHIVVDDAPGFASSRLGVAIGLEAIRMLESGVASAADIDAAMTVGYGHPMGPLALTDLVGLDVRLAIAEAIQSELKSEVFAPPALLRARVAAGDFGKKCGRGFYVWQDGKIVGENKHS